MWGKKHNGSSKPDLRRLIEEIRADRDRIRQDGHGDDDPDTIPNDTARLPEETPRRMASTSRAIQDRAIEQMRTALHQFQSSVHTPELAGRAEGLHTDELQDLKRRLQQLCQRIENVLNDIASEVQRLADEASRLAWREAVGPRAAPTALADYSHAAEQAPPAPEPEFSGAAPLAIAFVSVPDFESLLDVQAALIELAAVAHANVVEFEGEEAKIEAALTAPASVREIVDGLCQALGRQLLIENADTETHRLRLRFIEKDAARFVDDSILRPERWPKA